MLELETAGKIKFLKEFCFQGNNIRYHQFEPTISTYMHEKGSPHLKLVCYRSVMTTHERDTMFYALKGEGAYPAETKILRVHMIPSVFQKLDAQILNTKYALRSFLKRVKRYKLSKFSMPLC